MKISNPYFKDIPKTGNLYLDRVIVEYDYPLLSVLQDCSGGYYLCICYDTRGSQRWIVTKISKKDLYDVLTNQVELRKPFLESDEENILIELNYITREETCQFVPAEMTPDECLPEVGELLDADEHEWDEYVQELRH